MSAIHNWANDNAHAFEQILDRIVRKNENVEEIKTAIAECITESGMHRSGCSVIDALADEAADKIRERINFDDDRDAAEAEDAEEARREHERVFQRA